MIVVVLTILKLMLTAVSIISGVVFLFLHSFLSFHFLPYLFFFFFLLRLPHPPPPFSYTGLTTVLSGYFSGPPILISPESAAGIKAGAKTGVSTLVCGCLFGIATFFYPVFAAVPAAGTAPLLIMVGVMLFANVKVSNTMIYSDIF